MERPKIICLTPVKNEAWILKKFLESVSLWADHVVIADQGSSDGSVQIAKSFSKVILIHNTSKTFNEPERQKMLINEARKIMGPKVLIALDADESLTANSIGNHEWDIIKKLETGTVIKFDWVNLIPQKNIYWQSSYKMPFGFVDDGSEHIGLEIHSQRVPVPLDNPVYYPNDIKVMHFQYADWERMKSKHRWYQCWENINNKSRSKVAIYRQYHHMYAIKKSQFKVLPSKWLNGYKSIGLDYHNIAQEGFYYWDYEIIKLFNQYGLKFFSKIDIWDVDWAEVAKETQQNKLIQFNDPRTKWEKLVDYYLKKTQPFSYSLFLKVIDRLLIKFKF